MFDMDMFYKVAMLRCDILIEAAELERKWKSIIYSCKTDEQRQTAARWTELLKKKIYRLGEMHDKLCQGYY